MVGVMRKKLRCQPENEKVRVGASLEKGIKDLGLTR